MINHAASIVKTAISIPFTVLREGRKLVGSVLGGDNASEPSAARAEEEKAEIQAAIREQAKASIETVQVAEEIRERTVTAENHGGL